MRLRSVYRKWETVWVGGGVKNLQGYDPGGSSGALPRGQEEDDIQRQGRWEVIQLRSKR